MIVVSALPGACRGDGQQVAVTIPVYVGSGSAEVFVDVRAQQDGPGIVERVLVAEVGLEIGGGRPARGAVQRRWIGKLTFAFLPVGEVALGAFDDRLRVAARTDSGFDGVRDFGAVQPFDMLPSIARFDAASGLV